MFAKIFALFALFAVAFAAPNPKPQYLTYGYDYGLAPVAAGVPAVVSPYAATAAVAPAPVAYASALPVGAYYYR